MVLITNFSIDFNDFEFIVNSYNLWLIIISLLVLYFIYIFRRDYLTLRLFNILALNIIVFFFRSRIISFYITFEFALVPIVILILLRGYQPERVGARL